LVGSNYDTLLIVYRVGQPNTLANLQLIGYNDDYPGLGLISFLAFRAGPGVAHALSVDGWNGREGDVRITVTATAAAL
jgi:hypothetical protein